MRARGARRGAPLGRAHALFCARRPRLLRMDRDFSTIPRWLIYLAHADDTVVVLADPIAPFVIPLDVAAGTALFEGSTIACVSAAPASFGRGVGPDGMTETPGHHARTWTSVLQ